MRLTEPEIAGIRAAVEEIFGAQADVRLFGSRLDDSLKGGDIDLMVEVDPGQSGFRNETDLAEALLRYLGERRIDVVVRERGAPIAPIEKIALRDGARL